MSKSILLMSALLAASALAAAPPASKENPASKAASDEALAAPLAALFPELEALYLDLHQAPELSLHEVKTAARMARELTKAGFEVTTGVGGHGVVGVLRNGKGPTVLIRADMDALPVEEKTGLPYASKVTTVDDLGATVPVMHACGHDVHMTSWIGAARLLSLSRDRWKGTVLMVGQPAEEKGGGARAMLGDGLYTRFPKPDAAIAFHDSAELPAGRLAVPSGFALANVDSVDITIFGKGGHGAYPHTAVDPIVIGARAVLALQTLVSREKDPFEPAVVTVGSFHGGTKHNIIPDEVKLQLTVRSYKQDVRARILAGIERIVKAEAAAAGAPREPLVTISEGTRATYNDPALAAKVLSTLTRVFGKENAVLGPPVMGGEDFGEFAADGVPAVIFWAGAVAPNVFAESQIKKTPLPSLHSPLFAPDRATLKVASRALAAVAFDLLGKP